MLLQNKDTNISVNGNNVGIATDAGSIALASANAISLSGTSPTSEINLTAPDIVLHASDFKMNALPSGSQPNIIGYDTSNHKLYYQPVPTIPTTGFTATGGDSTTTFTLNGIQYKAHIFSTTGGSTFTITSFNKAN